MRDKRCYIAARKEIVYSREYRSGKEQESFMRLRNIPGAKDAIEESIYVVQEPQAYKGQWENVF